MLLASEDIKQKQNERTNAVTTRMIPEMGSDGSHFNVSLGSDGQSHKAVSTNTTSVFEEKEKPKRYRTLGVPSARLTSLTARPNRFTD